MQPVRLRAPRCGSVLSSARNLRCVHLLSDTHDAGAENQCRYLLSGLREGGEVDAELAYFGVGRGHAQFGRIGVPMLHVPRRGRFRFDAYGRARRLRAAYAGRAPDVLHTWMLEGNVIGLLAARAWPDTRVVITQRGSWNELDYPGLVRLQRLLLGRADHAISNSRGGAEMLASIGLERERISVIPNGIPADRVAVEEDPGSVRDRLGWADREVIAWVGRVDDDETVSQKDFAGLLASFAELRRRRPRALLALIGPTPAAVAARGFAVPDGAQALGWQAQPAELLGAADALAISSRIEGNSNVAGEALLAGVPVVTTDCGDHCKAVRRSGGRVVPVGDPGALAVALDELLDDPPAREAVRESASRELSVGRMVSETVDVYRRLVAG